MHGMLLLVALVSAVPEAPKSSENPAQTDTSRKKRSRKIRYGEIAARLADDRECAEGVAKLQKKSEPAAWRLLLACVDQDKVRRVSTLLASPWREHLEGMPREEQLRIAAHVIAASGDIDSGDLALLQEAKLSARSLSKAMQKPKGAVDDYVIFRGVLASRKLQKSGLVELVIQERTRATKDKIGWVRDQRRGGFQLTKTGSQDAFLESGRTARTEVSELPLLVHEGNEYVFLAVLRNVTGENEAFVRIVDVYKPGLLMPAGLR